MFSLMTYRARKSLECAADLLGLLSPQEIRKRLDRLGLNQKEFCEQIRIAPESLTRWLGGEYIQSRAYDELMRLFFEKAMTQHRIPKPNAVVVTEGTLFPWHCPVPYQYVPWSKTLLDSDVVPGSSGDLALAA